MKKMGASAENQGTAQENGTPGATPYFILDLARLSSGTCKLRQSEPGSNYATSNDHPFKDNKDHSKN
jgi:hypothetical protein